MVALVKNDSRDGAPYRLGMVVGLAAMVMLFTSLTSAYIVRAAASNDWVILPVPQLLWVSTGLILVSSVTLEAARRALRRAAGNVYQRWLVVTTLLGAAFLVCQLVAWRQLVGQGIYITSNPHSSFFYLLTATHAVHLVFGLLALVYLLLRYLNRQRVQMGRQIAVADAAAIYWHFMDALWLYLFLLLFLWK
jgi:cytochrome c oxidase subunit 3